MRIVSIHVFGICIHQNNIFISFYQLVQINVFCQFIILLQIAGRTRQNQIPHFIIFDKSPGNEMVHMHLLIVIGEFPAAIEAGLILKLLKQNPAINRQVFAFGTFIYLGQQMVHYHVIIDSLQIPSNSIHNKYFHSTTLI